MSIVFIISVDEGGLYRVLGKRNSKANIVENINAVSFSHVYLYTGGDF